MAMRVKELVSTAELKILSGKIIRSKLKDNYVPKLSLGDYIWKDLDKWSGKTALECGETRRSYSYSDVYNKSTKMANFLAHSNTLHKGNVIATILPNVPEYAMIMLGATCAGFKVTPLNPNYTRDELVYCLKISKPKLIFTLTDLWPHVNHAVKRSPELNVPIVVMNHRKELMDTPSGAIKLNEILENTLPSTNRTNNWNDVIYLPYSSGTTGLFKCIELTNKNIVSSLHHHILPEFKIQALTDANNQDVFPAILPFYHIYGMLSLLENMSLGCKAVTISKFTTQTLIHVLKYTKPTHCYLVPPIVQLLVNEPRIKPEYLTKIRAIAVGAAPLGVNDMERLSEKTEGKANILQAYGLTETAGAICGQTSRISGGIKPGGCGLTYPNVECKIANESGIMLGSNQRGTIFVRGPQVCKGFLDNRNAVLDSEGWLDTGDIGHYDEDGHLFVTDRAKEMIKVSRTSRDRGYSAKSS